MLLNDIFNNSKPDKAKEVNVNFLEKLKQKAEDYSLKNISPEWENIERFYAGNQWEWLNVKKDNLSFNNIGDVVWNFENSISNYLNNSQSGKPKKVVNITKSTTESFVAVFSEVDPLPQAESESEYNYDKELLNKINLLLKLVFTKENDINSLYKLFIENALVYGYCFAKIKIDIDKAKTQCPIKIRYNNPKVILVDPAAISVDEADYIIETIKVKYWEIKKFFDYKHAGFNKEPDDQDQCEIDNYWIRYRDDTNRQQWVLIPVYNKKLLKMLSRDGKALPLGIFDALPLQIFKHDSSETWYSKSFVKDIIPFNIEYNIVYSEQEWNRMKVIDKPTKGRGNDIEKVKAAQVPNGHYEMPPNGDIATMEVTLVPNTEFDGMKDRIKQDMQEVTGNIDVLTGRRQTGVYSGKLLETYQKSAQLKPKMMEDEFLKSMEVLAQKVLVIAAEYFGEQGVVIFDPEKQENVIVRASDIESAMYRIIIKTRDANLMTKEAKLEMIRDIMQYNQVFAEKYPYFIGQMYNNAVPNIIPDAIINQLKQQQEQGALPSTSSFNMGANPAGNELVPPATPEAPIPPEMTPEQMLDQDMPEEDFINEINRITQDMIDNNVPQKIIADTKKLVVDEELNNGSLMMDIVPLYEEQANKQINIFSGRE